jgi:hypothetical protein
MRRPVVFGILLAIVALGSGLVITRQIVAGIDARAAQPQPEPTADPFARPGQPQPVSTGDPYAPSTYGLPDRVAGYEIVAVITSDTDRCLEPGRKQVVLRAHATSVEDFVETSSQTDVRAELQRQTGQDTTDWILEFAGPAITREDVISVTEKWDEAAATSGCPQMGPIPSPPVRTSSQATTSACERINLLLARVLTSRSRSLSLIVSPVCSQIRRSLDQCAKSCSAFP